MADIIKALRKISGSFFNKEQNGRNVPLVMRRARILGDKSSFHVKEAYKALRTNVLFTIPHDGAKRIIVTVRSQAREKAQTV